MPDANNIQDRFRLGQAFHQLVGLYKKDHSGTAMKIPSLFFLVLLSAIGFSVVFLELARHPGLFANTTYLGALLVIEIVVACLWKFEKVFFSVTMGSFLWAATSLPGSGESFTVRWFFLGVGAVVGFTLWIRKSRTAHFGTFHLVALFCVLSALASASASSSAKIGLLKVVSLFLLFLYCSTGGRLALAGRETAFVEGIVKTCEISAFAVFLFYFAGYQIFGNRNNTGAFIGIIVTPVLLWAVLISEDRVCRRRRYIALALCGILLYATICRAAIIADILIMAGLTIALRRPRILIRVLFVGALCLEILAVANPSHMGELVDSFGGRFIFKSIGRPSGQGVFGSRRTPWDDTIAAVREHPWFGTGFGTSDLGSEHASIEGSSIYTLEGTNREHGSSYFAIAEYMGILGILPFLFLLFLLIRAVSRVFAWMRSTRKASHCAVPFALIIVAGLIHAGFEDWLFAVGSYLCVFFWVSAFLLIDLTALDRPDARVKQKACGFGGSPNQLSGR